ncbi:hypothetical protein C5C41_06745 [Rathayibacter sp. AY1E9]|uniref:hypothetical protein n=1 Tax=Rathayibacter sp. AY1E9 TaxID=2080556 RepID=UPI000CE7A096|nr:hypothetical protein [Rathayibacter sp. AY1E9]PPG53417.1 hypothetical protein C5C41_06745 [Rathayibacter sp. AY1E9]
MSLRTDILDQLVPLAPEGVQVHRGVTLPARIQKMTLAVAQNGISRNPQAPAVGLDCEFELFLLAPFEDLTKAEDLLDDHLTAVLDALDSSTNLNWSGITRATVDDRFPGYAITISTLVIRSQK